MLTGAGEIGVGRRITNLLAGYQGLLFIATDSSVFVLRGSSQSSFSVDRVATDYGALIGTAQVLEQPLVFSADGIRVVKAQDAGTGIVAETLSKGIRGLVDQLARIQQTPTTSAVVLGQSQYRVYFPTGLVIVAAYVTRMTNDGPRVMWEFATLEFPDGMGVEHVSTAKVTPLGGAERILFSFKDDDSGTVYQEGTTTPDEYPPEGFNGSPIKARIRLARNDLGMARLKKKFRTIAVSGRSARDMDLGVLVNNQAKKVRLKGRGDVAHGVGYQAPGKWDQEAWDKFIWGRSGDEATMSSSARVRSRDESAAITLSVPAPGADRDELVPPHILTSAHLGFTGGGSG